MGWLPLGFLVFWRRNDTREAGICSQDGVCEPVYYCTEEAGLWSKVKERPEEAQILSSERTQPGS